MEQINKPSSSSKPLLLEEGSSATLEKVDNSILLKSPPRMRRQHLDNPDPLMETDHGDEDHNGIIRSPQHGMPPLHSLEEHEEQHEHQSLPWYRNRQQVSAMISNFSTSYNVVNISLVLPILKASINASNSNNGDNNSNNTNSVHFDEDAVSAVASSLLAGMMLGQVLGGALGDVLGPSVALRGVMILQVLASLGSMTASTNSISSSSSSSLIFWYLAAWRFVLGVGAGGVYPLAAVLSAAAKENAQPVDAASPLQPYEDTTVADRNSVHAQVGKTVVPSRADDDVDDKNASLHRVVLTFSMQGLGFIAVPLVTVPLLYTVKDLNVVWRTILGLGCVPGACLLLGQVLASSTERSSSARHQMIPTDESAVVAQEESPSRSAVTDDDADANDSNNTMNENRLSIDGDVGLAQRLGWWESVRNEERLVPKLLGTAATWFLFDVLFYGNALFQPIVIEAAFGARDQVNPVHLLQRTAVDSLVLTSIALPGYAVAGWLLGKSTPWCYCGIEQTPRFVMLQGFTAMAMLYLVIGTCWSELRHFPQLLVLLYSLTFFFANYGPNTTTFVLPSLVYSPECRSTFNGLSAAAGKLGALTGASLFEPAANRLGDATVMMLCALIAGVSLIITKAFVPQSVGRRHADDQPHQHEPLSTAQSPVRNTIV